MGGSDEIAQAVIFEARRAGLSPFLIVGIIRTENAQLDPDVVNWYGAVGLMQVVEWLHGGSYPECGVDLTDVRTNICYGVRIFEYKLQLADGDVRRALLYYNGCWGATATPTCHTYPDKVEERVVP